MQEEEEKSFIRQLHDAGKEYLEARWQLARLQTFGKIAKVTAIILSFLIIALLACFTVVFVGLMSGFLLADLFDSNAIGFSIVGGLFILLLILLILKRESILEKPMTDKIIKALFEEEREANQPESSIEAADLSNKNGESGNT
ncbi:MAG: hypothetical protein K1X61_13935 [Chitinophagales bacterium]|nr:hypothetical protein [Chitinophagales bacterium]